jgi:hypothetical protein
MSATPRTLALSAILAVSGLFAPGCIIVADDDGEDGTITIDNRSEFFIDEIYVDDGPNEAPSDGLAPDDAITLTGFACDFYDVEIVDETGFGCGASIDACLQDALFIYRDESCTILDVAGEKSSKDAAAAAKN